MNKEEKPIDIIFSDPREVIEYIKNDVKRKDMAEKHQILMLRNCIFESSIDFQLLIYSLTENWRKVNRIDFSNSTFKGKVWLRSGRQEEIKDEKGRVIDLIHLNKNWDIGLDFSGAHFMNELYFESINFMEDVDFIDAIFEYEVNLKNLNFNKYLRIFGSTFNSDIYFAYSSLNFKTVFFTTLEDRPKFKGNVSFWGTTISDARFWDFIFEKNVDFTNTHFKCNAFFNRAKFHGEVILRSLETMGNTKFEGNVYFDEATIKSLKLENIIFDTTLSLNSAKIANIQMNNVLFTRNPLALSGTGIENISDEYTARILKHEAFKSSNQFLAIELRANEMDKHYQILKWTKQPFEKFVFWLNLHSNKFGLKWQRGMAFTLIVWFLFFSLFIIIRDGWGGTFIWIDSEYLKEAVDYFWVFSGMKGIGNQTSWLEILPFFLGKILIAYGIYQTVTAFRKHGQSK